MRFFKRLVLIVAVVAVVAAPASAGTASSPEISDPCGGQLQISNDQITFTPGEIDICSGWFKQTASGGLKVTLALAGPDEATGGFWAVGWRNGDCTFEVTVDEAVGAAAPQAFSAGCGPRPPVECGPLALRCSDDGYWRTYPLPASSVVRNGNTLAVSVDFTGALAEFAPAHQAGQVLRQPRAYAVGTVGPVYAATFGCSFDYSDHCFSVNGDFTATGRNYTVGS